MTFDRDLLFGLFAWQVGFVSSDALLQAARARAVEEVKTLADILVETGRLTSERRRLVEQLVEERCPSQSGGAENLPGVESLRDELQRALIRPGDVTFRRSEETLLLSPRLPSEAPPNVSSSAPTAAALRFRLLRPHAHGGLGEVLVAHDEELKREVALKRIRDPRLDTPENRARFVLEAEVTGGLEHPGIVPVYSLGVSDDGRPFYAMRFIKGSSLNEAIRRHHAANAAGRDESERLLQLRKLLARFVDVCNAIEYAHSRGVMHRDLKPENIMLGAYGETLVVDWGLAKPIGEPDPTVMLGPPPDDDSEADGAEGLLRPASASGTAPTQMGAAVGTPAYMSPEQAAGQVDQIGAASDVYSLGATLYCILCGRAPFDDPNAARVLERVRRGEISPPREVNGDVPAALDAICLKAMAFTPAERYDSPRLLADDLERWLADEPVTAHRGAWHERLARWARRHRRGVEAAAAALVLVSLVSVVAAVLVHSAKQLAERERDAAHLALEAETAAKREAHAALAAERQDRLEARRALDNFVGLIGEQESATNGRPPSLRRRLLRESLRDYDELIDKQDDGPIRHDLANAILRLGRIKDAQEHGDEATHAYRQTLSVLEKLAERSPDNPQYQSDLALCCRCLAEVSARKHDRPAAIDYFQQAIRRQRLALDLAPASDRYRALLQQYGQALADFERSTTKAKDSE